jgi:hypothetical protein
LLAKKKGSTGGSGTCAALIFSLRLSGGLTRIQRYIFFLKELADDEWFVFCGFTLSKF